MTIPPWRDPQQFWLKKYESEEPLQPREMFREAQQADHRLSEMLGWDTSKGPPPFKREPITRENLQAQGMRLWPRSFALLEDDEDIAGALRNLWATASNETEALVLRTPMGQVSFFSAARWAHYGFPVVQYSNHRYAAALMATKVSEGEILPPWKTFLIELPNNLLRTRNAANEYEDLAYCMVSYHRFVRDGAEVMGWTFDTYTRNGINLSNHRQTVDELRNGTDERLFDDDSPFAYELADEDTRTIQLINRLVLNTCMAMSNPDIVRPIGKHPKTTAPKGPHRNGKEPLSRIFRVGRDITLDCREALRSFVQGQRRGPLTVQFLVRGHWRQQACGPKFSDRRATWIEPYWKGPEDAPIPVRGMKVGS